MPRCPMQWLARWRARSTRMHALTPLAIRGQRHKVGQHLGDADRVVAAQSARLAVVMMIKTDRR